MTHRERRWWCHKSLNRQLRPFSDIQTFSRHQEKSSKLSDRRKKPMTCHQCIYEIFALFLSNHHRHPTIITPTIDKPWVSVHVCLSTFKTHLDQTFRLKLKKKKNELNTRRETEWEHQTLWKYINHGHHLMMSRDSRISWNSVRVCDSIAYVRHFFYHRIQWNFTTCTHTDIDMMI